MHRLVVARVERGGPRRVAEIERVLPQDILVNEDNADAAQTLADVLALNGHRVDRDRWRSGSRSRGRSGPGDLCHIGLPDLDGYDVARIVRATPSPAGARLIALTETRNLRPEPAEKAGFEAHVAKPPDPEALERVLSAGTSPEPRPAGGRSWRE